ncbi:hypothetical protein M378DRAFT_14294 [Amanita muscaria Koide BX008]|uniref:Uncharacterized protein n=1 Tax=Amanita muscaria (strain Koide BX008) TaxID=946122 RepID=A0A0C2SBJ1_AMAMK|nr:hypothetical protein M378DRAFT_14294 [Amanita muscaria Koide BX008]
MPRTLAQLAMHEAGLVQLKRKWESFKSPPGSTSPSSLLPYNLMSSTTINTPAVPIPTGTVFEGSKESEQVDRIWSLCLSASGDRHHHNSCITVFTTFPITSINDTTKT